jgi:hypothetical protein
MDDINTIGVVGLSQMGSGIVEVCARDLQALPLRPASSRFPPARQALRPGAPLAFLISRRVRRWTDTCCWGHSSS